MHTQLCGKSNGACRQLMSSQYSVLQHVRNKVEAICTYNTTYDRIVYFINIQQFMNSFKSYHSKFNREYVLFSDSVWKLGVSYKLGVVLCCHFRITPVIKWLLQVSSLSPFQGDIIFTRRCGSIKQYFEGFQRIYKDFEGFRRILKQD